MKDKKKNTKSTAAEIKAELSSIIDFSVDFHTLSSSQVELLAIYYKHCKYNAPSAKNRNGSKIRYFFYHLAKK